MTLLEPITMAVAGSESFPFRTVTWTNLGLGGPALGLMVIQERKSPTGAASLYRYAVRELAYEGGFRFRVASPLGAAKNPAYQDEGEPYYCFLADGHPHPTPGPGDLCDCRGFESTGVCKHLIGLRRVAGAGAVAGVSLKTLARKKVLA